MTVICTDCKVVMVHLTVQPMSAIVGSLRFDIEPISLELSFFWKTYIPSRRRVLVTML